MFGFNQFTFETTLTDINENEFLVEVDCTVIDPDVSTGLGHSVEDIEATDLRDNKAIQLENWQEDALEEDALKFYNQKGDPND